MEYKNVDERVEKEDDLYKFFLTFPYDDCLHTVASGIEEDSTLEKVLHCSLKKNNPVYG